MKDHVPCLNRASYVPCLVDTMYILRGHGGDFPFLTPTSLSFAVIAKQSTSLFDSNLPVSAPLEHC